MRIQVSGGGKNELGIRTREGRTRPLFPCYVEYRISRLPIYVLELAIDGFELPGGSMGSMVNMQFGSRYRMPSHR
ncbi:hypothetical protein K449DRAFT_206651 [Hypoxylon sp. EC38]|nr:hypothetical protein K449DRAFT_206651 [Hypoxylon sp. EC38]